MLTLSFYRACYSQTGTANGAPHFNFAPGAGGTFGTDVVEYYYDSDGHGVKFMAMLQSVVRANTEDCNYALRRIVDVCTGRYKETQSGWSRGGWWQYENDNSTYNVDPDD